MKKFFTVLLGVVSIASAFCFASASAETVRVLSFAGDVKITPAGKAQAAGCKADMLLGSGDRVETGRESYIEIAFDRRKKNVVRIEERSDVVIRLADEQIELVDGELYAVIERLERGDAFKVRTPCVVCGVRGTGWNAKTTEKESNVSVLRGEITVRGIKEDGSLMERSFIVREGFERRIKRFQRPEKMERIAERRFSKMMEKVRPLIKDRPRKPAPRAFRPEPKTGKRWKGRAPKAEMMERKQAAEKVEYFREERRASAVDKKEQLRLDRIQEQRAEDTRLTTDAAIDQDNKANP
ncbi:MAG: FecR family protein [Candidatus Omnitrophota bacterium]|jgi:hypothetical protein